MLTQAAGVSDLAVFVQPSLRLLISNCHVEVEPHPCRHHPYIGDLVDDTEAAHH